MIITTNNNIGFKDFAKNLKKMLTDECEQKITHTQSLEKASNLLGYSNYNLFAAESKKSEDTLSLIHSHVDNIKEKLLYVNPFESLALVKDLIVQDLNIEYKSKLDKHGRYLNFSIPASFNQLEEYKDQKVILVEKEYLGSIRQIPKETLVMKYSFDKNNLPILNSESKKELKAFSKDFNVQPLKLYKRSAFITIDMSNYRKKKYNQINIIVPVGDYSGVMKIDVINVPNGIFQRTCCELYVKDTMYSEDDISHEQLVVLIETLGLQDDFVYAEYLKNYDIAQKIEQRNFFNEDLEENLRRSLVRWIIEKKIGGFFNTVLDVADIILDYSSYDEILTIREDFFEAYKKSIKNGEMITLDMLSGDIVINISRRDTL